MAADFEKYNEGIWVFLSHSNKDYEQVRLLRNMMEEKGLRPLMFFLKCLESDPEIFELIKREIDVRPRFFLCDSENAQNSVWVQREVDYIKSKNRQYITVDLNDPDSFEKQILEIKSRSQVFLSYSHKDYSIAEKIVASLQQRGFNVFDYKTDIPAGYEIPKYLARTINGISQDNGYFIPIITNNYISSQFCKMELIYALKEHTNIFPCIINDCELSLELNFILSNIQMTPIYTDRPNSINDFCNKLIEFDLKRNK